LLIGTAVAFATLLTTAFAQPSGTLVWGLTGDPVNNSWIDTKPEQFVYQTMFNTLIRFSTEDFSIQPELAESWSVSDDGLSWTFTLRDDVRWHDGEALTADDVAFTFTSILNPDINAGYHRPSLADVAGIDVLDDVTVRIDLKTANFDFLPLLGDFMHIYPQHVLEGQDLNNPIAFLDNPIGTGPFKFGEHIVNDSYTVVANEDYFKGAPQLERIVFKVLPDTTVQVAQLRTGELDVAHRLSASDISALRGVPGITIFDPPTVNYWHMFMNNPSPLLSDKRVRQALHYAIDRQLIIDQVMDGNGVLGEGPVGEALGIWHNPELVPYPYDPERALALFAEAGWEDTDGDGILDRDIDDDGVRDPWSADIIVIPAEAAWLDISLVVQQHLQEIGQPRSGADPDRHPALLRLRFARQLVPLLQPRGRRAGRTGAADRVAR
jgi:peptide/nickel transport system substrate-binding protein